MAASMSIWPPTTSVTRLAGRTVLLQVQAQSRQFAVWHQDQIVKLPPIKGLVGQEMVLADYLQYILQEALAAPRRASARRGRQSPTAASLGGGSLIFVLHPPAFSGACSHWSKCGKTVVFLLDKDAGNQILSAA